MEDLVLNLLEKGWNNKRDLYERYFSYVLFRESKADATASIIMISWKYCPLILVNVQKLKAYDNIQLIFVNNGSDDKEFDNISKVVDVYIKLNSNTGAYLARNIGALFSICPILIFLEDDGLVHDRFVESHLDMYVNFDIISVRGVCEPLTKNKLNSLARHYYLGNKIFPMYANLEGNCSYKSNIFFDVGGWNDHINFGHGGAELSYRITSKFPDKAMQVYSPYPIIYHDFISDEVKLKVKLSKQVESYKNLLEIYPDWDRFFESWRELRNKTHLIKLKRFKLVNFLNHLKSFIKYELLKKFLIYVRLK